MSQETEIRADLQRLSLYPLTVVEGSKYLMTNSVATMLSISHSIEDTVMRYRIKGTYYAGFQRLSAFLPQHRRYLRLASICGKVYVFAYPDAPMVDIPNVEVIPLAEDAPLTHEWFILFDTPAFGVTLLTRQLDQSPRRASAEFGRGRFYEGVFSFQDELISAAQRALVNALHTSFQHINRPPDAAKQADSPYGFFNRALVANLEGRNQQLQGLYQTLTEHSEEVERLQSLVRTLVSQDVWQQAQAAVSAEAGGHNEVRLQEVITVLVTDIQNFTLLTDQYGASALLDDLNRYLDLMATAVYQERGDVDKFLGDGMLAFFRDPKRAVGAAGLLQRRIQVFNDQQIAARRPVFQTRIGITSGYCIRGWVGSRDRRELMILGETVNMASRLQALSPVGGLVMDQATYRAIGMPPMAARTMASIKGKRGLQALYEIDPEMIQGLRSYVMGGSSLDGSGDNAVPHETDRPEQEQ